ncbi:hypothetical protein SBADM41S_10101 [Streptomyces badius]
MANFSKSRVPQFSVEVYQNEFLPEGGREVNAIVTVTSTGGGTTGGIPLADAPPSRARCRAGARRGRGADGRLFGLDDPADEDAQRT